MVVTLVGVAAVALSLLAALVVGDVIGADEKARPVTVTLTVTNTRTVTVERTVTDAPEEAPAGP